MFNIGLSNQKINGRISVFDRMNIGGPWVEPDANGNMRLDKLDNIKIEENFIDLIKIDVEGHELRVLQGAKETLQKYKPAIFIEILEHSDNQKETHEYLTNMGYRLEKQLPHCNYLYLFDAEKDGRVGQK